MQTIVQSPSSLSETEPIRSGMHLGHVADISTRGEVFVDCSGISPDVRKALLLAGACENLKIGDRVVLLFEPDESFHPIILGAVSTELPGGGQYVELQSGHNSASKAKEVVIDEKSITLTGKERVVLRCGDSSITLNKDGKILIKGTHLVSSADRTNRIKGSTVAIN